MLSIKDVPNDHLNVFVRESEGERDDKLPIAQHAVNRPLSVTLTVTCSHSKELMRRQEGTQNPKLPKPQDRKKGRETEDDT